LKPLISAASWILLLYLSYCTLLFFLQRHMLFPRDLIQVPSSSQISIQGLEKLRIPAKQGNVEAWFIKPEFKKIDLEQQNKPLPALIFAHGNAEIIDFWVDEFKNITDMGIGILLVEYPGYGRSAGNPSQESITRVFIDAYDMLVSRSDVDPDRIILMGRSLGGGAVCQLAANRPCAALILMSTFTSARSFTKRYLVPGFLMRDPFDNLEVIKNYANPVLVIHGKKDEVIPFAHGEKLAKAAPNSTMIEYICGHNDCPPDWKIFRSDVKKFLSNAKIIHSSINSSYQDK